VQKAVALSADPSFAALAMPLPLRRVKVLRLLSLSRANEIRHGLTQPAKTGWLDTRCRIPPRHRRASYGGQSLMIGGTGETIDFLVLFVGFWG